MKNGTNYRFEAALEAFPNIKKLGVGVTDSEGIWYVDAQCLEKRLAEMNPPETWWDRNGVWVVIGMYASLFLAAKFGVLPSSFLQPWSK